MDLDEIRQVIDEIDSGIIDLLSRRACLVASAGSFKKNEEGVRDRKRVEEVIAVVRSRAEQAGLDPEIAEKIYRTIIDCFIRKELHEFNKDRGGGPGN